MIGNPQHPGIMVLTMRDLFHAIADKKSERQYHLSVSYMEIYNETIRDLLVENSKPLALREDGDKGTVTMLNGIFVAYFILGTCTIAGLSSQVPTSVEEVMELLAIGNARRSQHPTDANKESSRSHAVFQVRLLPNGQVFFTTNHYKPFRSLSVKQIAQLTSQPMSRSESCH